MKIRQGTTVIFDYAITRAGAPQNLTGYKVWFTVKTSNLLGDEDDSLATISHSWAQGSPDASVGISRTDPETLVEATVASGLLFNELTPVETAALELGRLYYYDVKVLSPIGKARTLDSGTIEVEAATTQRITVP